MNTTTKIALYPTMFLVVATVGLLGSHHGIQTLSLSTPVRSEPVYQTRVEQANPTPSEAANQTVPSVFELANATSPDQSFADRTQAELMNLSHDELFNYMMDYRQYHLFDANFMGEEYDLFRFVLDVEPFAALDYMIAIGHDTTSEFFYQFLYSDFMINEGKSTEVVDYINRFGPNVALMNLVVYANLTDQISPLVQRDILNEYVLGNVDYYRIIEYSQWDDLLSTDDKVQAFLNTVPEYVEDPYDLLVDVVAMNNPSTFDHLARYIEVHPDRYRLYGAIKTLDTLDLQPTIDRLMARFPTLEINDQVQTALIAMQSGNRDALRFLLDASQQPLILYRAINVEFNVLGAIQTPDYINKTMSWAREHVDALVFNPFTGKFEY